MQYKAKFYLPAVATSLDDLLTRHEMLSSFQDKSIDTGLMLVLKERDILYDKNLNDQLININKILNKTERRNFSFIFMHPNMPIEGSSRFNFLNNPEFSKQYMKNSIDFIEKVPHEAFNKNIKILTFHLNTLISYKSWNPDYSYWRKAFDQILSHLEELQLYADQKNVKLAIETSPIPEFGDLTEFDTLRNPFPLLLWRKEVESLRRLGINLVIDICHSFIALKTIQEVKNLIENGHKDALNYYGLFINDLEYSEAINDFSNYILYQTKENDIWHMSDARGTYKVPQFQGIQTHFEEGVSFYEGDIPNAELQKLIKEGFKLPINIILEVNEKDFINNPNTKKSLDRILESI